MIETGAAFQVGAQRAAHQTPVRLVDPGFQVDVVAIVGRLAEKALLVGVINAPRDDVPVPEADAAGGHGHVHLLFAFQQRLVDLLTQIHLIVKALIGRFQFGRAPADNTLQLVAVARQLGIEPTLVDQPLHIAAGHQRTLPGGQQNQHHQRQMQLGQHPVRQARLEQHRQQQHRQTGQQQAAPVRHQGDAGQAGVGDAEGQADAAVAGLITPVKAMQPGQRRHPDTRPPAGPLLQMLAAPIAEHRTGGAQGGHHRQVVSG